jgi:hypothetical protein
MPGRIRRLICFRQMTTCERIFPDCPRQAGSDWVPEHVVDVTLGAFVRPKNVVEESDLPETLPASNTRILFSASMPS